jgi:hypothetical protein
MRLRETKGAQEDKGVLEYVVAERTDELGYEERQEAAGKDHG